MRRKIRKYKLLLYEICETLVTLCLFLADRRDPMGRRYSYIFRDHAAHLKRLSDFLRDIPRQEAVPPMPTRKIIGAAAMKRGDDNDS